MSICFRPSLIASHRGVGDGRPVDASSYVCVAIMPSGGDTPPDALPLGWQATRTVVAPAPAPLAGVSATGVLELRAELERLRSGGAQPKRRRVKGDALAGGKNAGVEARAARDAAAAAEVATNHSMERKAALYDALAEGRVAPGPDGLVDFSGRARPGGPTLPRDTATTAHGFGYDDHDPHRAARVAAAAHDASGTAAARAAAADTRAAAEAAAAARRAALRRRFVRAKVEELVASGADPATAP